MTTLPTIPKDRNWSPETWRAGLDEAVGRTPWSITRDWNDLAASYDVNRELQTLVEAIIAHATTLLDAGIVKPVVSEAAMLLEKTFGGNAIATTVPFWKCPTAIAVIQSALDKARAGG